MIGKFKHGTESFEGNVQDERVTSAEGDVYDLNSLDILPPSSPSKIICVGLNYIDHAKELDMDIPDEPIIFMKPPSSVIGHDAKIIYPSCSNRVDYEAELAVVIGQQCHGIHAESAQSVIKGYTCFNDVTARDLQQKDGQWTRAKGFDTFSPIGPFITPAADFDACESNIKCSVNGMTRQNSSTSRLIFDVDYLIEFISSVMTLEKGDVIATGTPQGVGELNSGDSVDVTIEGIGTLSNEVS
ncbi:fumarylacetoacetate hydrolase family protein [Methanohalophilus halophilus]|uniref:2-hydroxyhepta-2,4-diene-1,7-dioate isomerase n=1 Tax=Methanohalophilus halophilus TaxID=2177 RepID=A0A1L3Q2X1_9EURY|nr:fumarylacetoacetate hydrolase family protein [Methanohalophilus halophilus]APH39141.1 2-hydroxyhepta-2,4-diene-1,7-dioate isomerase [Methanohalophilus halophilus]RNI09802.1 FAA hydrolase family protein [Methanohalophilus halophilus]SDW57682.1 2-keto-4-pentenoate hydratase/2-oxohepta-3-ene-1,7-dioic acid hydratase (catechol pathway) [Methanohalophilus halophilus]